MHARVWFALLSLRKNGDYSKYTLNVTTAQIFERSVTINNSPIQDYTHPDDHTPPSSEN